MRIPPVPAAFAPFSFFFPNDPAQGFPRRWIRIARAVFPDHAVHPLYSYRAYGSSEPFPPPFLFGDTSALVRALMPRQVTLTMLEDSLVPAGQLPGDSRYFAWQRAFCGDGRSLPSHQAVARYAARYGTDYRFERNPSPIEALQNRRQDNTLLGREAMPEPAP